MRATKENWNSLNTTMGGAEAVLEDFLGEVLFGLRTEGWDGVKSQRLGEWLSGKGKSMCN